MLWVTVLAFFLMGCASPEKRARQALKQRTGVVRLPAGVVEVSSELTIPDGAHDLEIIGSGTILRASEEFRGRAIISASGARRLKFRDFIIEGSRVALEKPTELIPPENAFRLYYSNNGLLFDRVEGLEISGVQISDITNFAILASRCSGVRISRVEVQDSGSRNARGRNNTTGGILLEEGTTDFAVINSVFRRIRGNALWTHSLRTSPRASGGLFEGNRFDTIGRDAIQVGHATNVRVIGNEGVRIGYPVETVDIENGGTPVGVDTAGNVDQSIYERNRFEEINGKCIDLDGFHNGSILRNTCISRKPPEEYPTGHFAIVMNNTDPDMRSENIRIEENEIDGTKYGGIYLLGRGHRILQNRMRNLNTARCNESGARFGCLYKMDEPDMLQSGIYLGRGVARLEETRGNIIQGNLFHGHRMDSRCVVYGPGVSRASNTASGNQCQDSTPR